MCPIQTQPDSSPMVNRHQPETGGGDLSCLVEAIRQHAGDTIRNLALLRRALTHRSFSNEQPDLAGFDNERLEFLGDAILDFLAGDYLFRHYPENSEWWGSWNVIEFDHILKNSIDIVEYELFVFISEKFPFESQYVFDVYIF